MIVTARLAPGSRGTPEDWSSTAAALAATGVTALVLAETGHGSSSEAAPLFEATTLAGRLALTSPGLALIASDTASTGFPYNVARRLATVDHLASGRAGWHLASVTDATAEFADVVQKLWASWEPGAEAADKADRTFHDDDRIHDVDHRGERFTVLGPLDVPRTPQGRPVVHADVDAADDPALVARLGDVVVVRCVAVPELTAVTAAVRKAVVAAGRGGAVRILAAASGSPTPGAIDVGPASDPVPLGAAVQGLIDQAGVDGVELIDDAPGSTWALDAAAVILRPDAVATAAASHRTLLARLDLDGAAA